jgi:hypothetical protein
MEEYIHSFRASHLTGEIGGFGWFDGRHCGGRGRCASDCVGFGVNDGVEIFGVEIFGVEIFDVVVELSFR